MPHIELDESLPGIRGLFAFRPETGQPLQQLAEALLRGDSTLERGERELIAAYVSRLNDCNFCCWSHSAFAAKQLEGGYDVVDATLADLDTAPVSSKMKALLRLAGKVQQSGKAVTEEDIAAARAEGATDQEIHDAVLIAAAFCMFNRYVDGLGTVALPTREAYEPMGHQIVEMGYAASTPSLPG